MTYVVALPCIDTLDRACIDACPVDCIYEGNRTVYIHPDECIDCGACEAVCPVLAIYEEDALPVDYERFAAENATFFSLPLPGADRPLGSPGGAAPLGPTGVDTPWIATLPARPRLSW